MRPWQTLQSRCLSGAAAVLQHLSDDWLQLVIPSERPSVQAALDKLTPRALNVLRTLPQETWEALDELGAALEAVRPTLSPAALASMPFLTDEAAEAIGSMRGRR